MKPASRMSAAPIVILLSGAAAAAPGAGSFFSPPPFPTLAPSACYSATLPSQLTVNGALSGAVAASPAPLLGWSLPPVLTASAGYELRVTAAATGALLWASGWVAAANATSAQYGGPALARPFTFAVRAEAGGAWSAPSAEYLVGLPAQPEAGGWGAGVGPIWAPGGAGVGGASGALVLLRGELPLPAAFARATLHITANPQPSARDHENAKLLAAYRAYADGALVGLGPGRPGRCGPVCPVGGPGAACRCAPEQLYDSYDITAAAQAAAARGEGALVLALQAFQAPAVAGTVAQAAGAVLATVAFDAADGSRVLAGTVAGGGGGGGGDWRALDATGWMSPGCCAAEVWFFQPSENWDGRQEPVGWRSPGFDARGWPAAAAAAPAFAPLAPRPTLSLLQVGGLAPARVQLLAPGHLFVDLGREIQGGLSLAFPASTPAGASFALQLGEELAAPEPAPAVMWKMRTGNVYRDVVTTRAGEQVIEHSEYREFRFAEVVWQPPGGAAAQCLASAPGDYATPVTLACALPGATIASFAFASYGAPGGACAGGGAAANNSFVANATCACAGAAARLASLCAGRANCTLTPSDAVFCGGADPCHLTPKRLAAAWHCSADPPPAPPPPAAPPALPEVSAWQVVYPAAYIDEAARRCPGGAAGLPAGRPPPRAPAAAPLPPAPGGGAAQFSSSEPALNAVFRFALYTVEATGLDVFTDSNTRQRSVICAEALLATNLDQLASSYEGALPLYTTAYHVYTVGPNFFGWAEWPQLILRSLHELQQGLGGSAAAAPAPGVLGSPLGLFADSYALMQAFTEAALLNASLGGLWACPDPPVLGCQQPEVDWPPAARAGFVMTPANTVVNAHTHAALLYFASLADAAGGHAADAAAARAAAARLRAAAAARLWNASARAYRDGATTAHAAIHSTAFALAGGLADAATAAAAWPTLLAALQGGVPVGPYPALFLADALFANASDLGVAGVHGLILSNASHSWLGQLRQGATTTMEAWDAAEKPNLTWSHPWMALVLQAIIKYVVGAQPTAPGWAALRVRPQPGRVANGSAAVPTPRGPVGVAWAQDWPADAPAPAAFALRVALPGAANARLCLPLAACGAGARVLLDGASVQGAADGEGYVCLDGVGAGEHLAACPAGAGAEALGTLRDQR